MNEHDKIEHELPNGDILIVDATRRDPKVEAAFRVAREELRAQARRTYARLATTAS